MSPLDEIDLGSGFYLRYTSWRPDRELNPQYDEIPDLDKVGAIIRCKHGIEGSILFDHGKLYENLFPNHPKWRVTTWEPLSISPSIQTGCCHGYIIDGNWHEA